MARLAWLLHPDIRMAMAGESEREWLVTDSRGGFAMGTPAGLRTRKYHGFFSEVVGRGETAYLMDLDIRLNGEPIWPHRHREGAVEAVAKGLRFSIDEDGPSWTHTLDRGVLRFSVRSNQPAGIELRWKWEESDAPVTLTVRPFFALRPLRGMGGEPWHLERGEAAVEVPAWRAKIVSESSDKMLHAMVLGNFEWINNPQWHREFYYSEEEKRGYLPGETLFSQGLFSISLKCGELAAIVFACKSEELSRDPADWQMPRAKTPALDFVLFDPPSIVAGYPWFGEQGRDTFVALPGIVAAWLEAGGDPDEVANWAESILERWSRWIERVGMIPNWIGPDGTCQWEAADTALWWCHSLAALWAFSLSSPSFRFTSLEEKYRDRLAFALKAIETGRHLFLSVNREGLLEVTEPHVTWMDARIEGAAVTRRVGILPEINALWFQARCLLKLWCDPELEIETLGLNILKIHEAHRPNEIFLHSLPLAPSFVLGDRMRLKRDLAWIAASLWTPVGLRTLDPRAPEYRSRCLGDQWERDAAYHCGGVWAWLGGHFEMAKDRWMAGGEEMTEDLEREMLSAEAMLEQPIAGHIAEIFDGEAPHTARGAPAQAWSLACIEEARERNRHKVDNKLTEVFARRWLGRGARGGRGGRGAA